MNNQGYSKAILNGSESSKFTPRLQARGVTFSPVSNAANPVRFNKSMKTQSHNRSPMIQLAETRARRIQRITLPQIPRNSLLPSRTETLASLRAAELAFWQESGGDFLSLDQ